MTTDIRQLFPEVQTAVKPVILSHAKKISAALGIPMDDAIQEMNIVLFRGLRGYDYNRGCGGLHRYVDAILRNSAASIINGANATTRVPHVVYRENGKLRVVKKRHLVSLDELASDSDRNSMEPIDPDGSPEDLCLRTEMDQKRARLRMRLLNKLGDKEKTIFILLTQPTEAFFMFMRNIGIDEPTHAAIARFLGVSKNVVDYAGLNIRTLFTKIAEKEFPELIKGHLDRGIWPMIHVSRTGKPDHDFVKKTIQERKLDPRPVFDSRRDIEIAGNWAREIHSYPWGVVLIIKKDDTYRTLVIEGTFNRLSGGVSGTDGTWKNVADEVPWYPKLVRELANAQEKAS